MYPDHLHLITFESLKLIYRELKEGGVNFLYDV